MTAAVVVGVLGGALVAGIGLVVTLAGRRRHARGPDRPGFFTPAVARWGRTRSHLREDLGPVGGGLLVGAAGAAVTFAVAWPAGRLAKALEPAVDRPVFSWFQARNGAGWWRSAQEVLTQMGDRTEIKAIGVVAAVCLAVAWRRRWWLPVLVVAAAFVVEKYVQTGLSHVVARGHPPTTRGTYPSGGCARLISVYGTIIWLAVRTWQPPRWVRGLLWTLLAEAAWWEGYARTFLLQHWVTDVVGGLLVGGLLLLTFALTTSVLTGPEPHRDPERGTLRRVRGHAQRVEPTPRGEHLRHPGRLPP